MTYDGTNNVAECEATKEALTFGIKISLRRVHLEWDFEIIINGTKKERMDSWHLDKHISQSERLLHEFDDFRISHTY